MTIFHPGLKDPDFMVSILRELIELESRSPDHNIVFADEGGVLTEAGRRILELVGPDNPVESNWQLELVEECNGGLGLDHRRLASVGVCAL